MKQLFIHIYCGLLLLLMSLPLSVFSQSTVPSALSNLRTKTIAIPSNMDTLVLDTLSIVPSSLKLFLLDNKQPIDTTTYQFYAAKAQLIWQTKPSSDSIKATYRVLPYALTKTYTHKDPKQVLSPGEQAPQWYHYNLRKQQKAPDIFDLGGVNYSGSFGRGISFGNNQDLVVNSNFNMQMTGKLPNGVEVTAAITDNNIPFQPEGNTQQIQEFDRIFIQLKKNRSILLLGDYDLKRPPSYFMNFSRRLQGINFKTAFDIGNKGTVSSSASGAVAKGNYNRMSIVGQEGNQGPYKLTGSNGESFIIILSGSERVYIDGQLLTRGADNDYIIDYNTAEVSFTANQVITKDKRLIIEFEYADQNYLRSLFYVNSEYKSAKEKLTIRTDFFTEQDAKNQLLIEGSTPDRYISAMQNIGDDIENAVVSSGDSIGYSPDRVMYAMVDTLVNQLVYDSIFVQSNVADAAIYGVSFSNVGANKGYYVLSTNNINGRIYEWVAPDSLTGTLQGSYAPIIKLITPKKRQLLSVGTNYKITPNNSIDMEVSVSNKDVNTFSDVNDADDVGTAAKLSYKNTLPLNNTKTNLISTNLQYEYRQKYFEPLEAYRPVEFGRNWNVNQNDTSKQNEHIGLGSIALKLKSGLQAKYQLGIYRLDNKVYEGMQQVINLAYNNKGWQLLMNGSYLESNSIIYNNTKFFRPNFNFSKGIKRFKGWRIGIKGEQEKNQIVTQETDSLTSKSFYYNQLSFYTQTPSENANSLNINYTLRYDYAPVQNDFKLSTTANTLTVNGALTSNPKNQLRWNITYRNLTINDSTLTTQKKQETLLGDFTYTTTLAKGFIRSSTQYQLGAGQKQSSEYYYERVADGTGNYVWLDTGNGIEELGEFENATEATQIDAHYIRILLPTSEYLATNIVQFNESLQISPRALWSEATGIKKYIALLSTQSNISIRRESIANAAGLKAYVPFINLEDTIVVSENTNIRNTLFLNRNSPKFEASVYALSLVNTNFLVGGIDSRTKTEQGATIRYGLSKKISAKVQASQGTLANRSQSFDNRNYHINNWNIEPSFTFLPNKTFRWQASYKYQFGQDINPAPEERLPATINKLSTELKYGSAIKTAVTVKFSYALINFDGTNNTPAAYSLLDGLQTGNNYLWSVGFNTKLSGNINLNFSYDGRKSGDARVNHVSRAGLRAVF